MTVGRPFLPISFRAARILSILWPSTMIASQPKAPNLRARAAEIVLVHGPVRLAEPVDVDDGDEIAELPAGRGGGRFPDLAFGAFAVAHEDEGPGRGLVEPLGQGHSDADRQSLTERARRGLDPRHAGGRVALEVARDLPEVEEALERDDAGLGVDRPEEGRGMALGEDELVAPRIVAGPWCSSASRRKRGRPRCRPRRDRSSGVPSRPRWSWRRE